MPASPNRHFAAQVSAGRYSSVNFLINGVWRKRAIIPLGERRQIGRFDFEFGAERACTLRIDTVARSAV
jgi:hypothetical protein